MAFFSPFSVPRPHLFSFFPYLYFFPITSLSCLRLCPTSTARIGIRKRRSSFTVSICCALWHRSMALCRFCCCWSPYDVLHDEPQNLIPDTPRLRPADTALSLESMNNSQHSCLLLDYSTSVKATNLPPLTSVTPLDSCTHSCTSYSAARDRGERQAAWTNTSQWHGLHSPTPPTKHDFMSQREFARSISKKNPNKKSQPKDAVCSFSAYLTS